MFDPRIGSVLRHAARLFGRPEPSTTDATLLDRFIRSSDQAAFAELVTRHGPAVWTLCRRVVRTEADAEDVFQATFLVLARNARRIRNAASIKSWLFGVAFRLGRKVQARASRPLDTSRLSSEPPTDPAEALTWLEVRTALNEELARLPDNLRTPILLCYFDGMTQDEVAGELGWKTRTVKARIARGRDLLRARLSRRGIELPAAFTVPLLSGGVADAVSPNPSTGLAVAAVKFLQRKPPGSDVSPVALQLARMETSPMSALRVAIVIASGVGLLTAGSLLGRAIGWEPDRPAPVEAVAAAEEPVAARNDPEEPIPPGAISRIGTTQFRQVGWHMKVFFTADGKNLIATKEGRTVNVWAPETGRFLHTISLGNSTFQDADFAPKSGLLAVIGSRIPDEEDGKWETTIWLVDVAARKVTRTIRMSDIDHSVDYRIRFTPDGKRLVTGIDGELRVWDVKTGDELLRQKMGRGVDAFAISPDGKTVAFGRYDLFLWHWEAGEEPRRLASIGGFGVDLAAFAPDGKSLYASMRGRKTLTAWDVATGRQTRSLSIPRSFHGLAFSPDRASLAVCDYESNGHGKSYTHFVTLLDAATGTEQARFPLGHDRAERVSWSPDGSRLATATSYRIFAWDVKSKKPLAPASVGHEGTIGALAFAPDGRLFTASDDHTIRSWNPATGRPELELPHGGWVRGVAISPDGSMVAGSSNQDVRLWDARTGELRFKLLGHGRPGGKRRVRFTPDGKQLISWGDDLYLRAWDTRNGKLLNEHPIQPAGLQKRDEDDIRRDILHFMALSDADISPDGSTFVLGTYRSVQVFDTSTGKELRKLADDPDGVAGLSISPDGKHLAISSRARAKQIKLSDGTTRTASERTHAVSLWELSSGKRVWEVTAEGSNNGRIGFSPDGSRLVEAPSSQDEKACARFWEAATGKEIGRIDWLDSYGIFAFDRTGKRLAVALRDTTAIVYDLETALKPVSPTPGDSKK